MDYKELVELLKEWDEHCVSELCGKDVMNCDDLCINRGQECIVYQAISAIETLLAERDALYKLAKRCPMQNAIECSHYEECFKNAYDNMRIMRCASYVGWQWRGPQKHD